MGSVGSSFFVDVPPATHRSLRAKALLSDTYRFLDVAWSIRTDAPAVIDYFRAVYGRFLIDSPTHQAAQKAPDARRREHRSGAYCVVREHRKRSGNAADGLFQQPVDHPVSYYVLSESAHPDGPRLLWGDGRACPLPAGEALAASAEAIVTSGVLLKVRSHLVLHGVAVSWNDRGVILAGLSGSGKTTLCGELANRGFAVLSDELACLSRATHQIEPFPKAFGVRGSGLGFARGVDLASREPVLTAAGERKWMVDMGEIPGLRVGTSCPARTLILLETRDRSERLWPEGAHDVEVVFRGDGCAAMADLSEVDGVLCGPMRDTHGGTVGRASVRKHRPIQEAFLRWCRSHQDEILYRVRVGPGFPDGSREPERVPVSRWEASVGCLEHLQNLQFDGDRALSGGFRSAVGTLAELSSIIAEMDCYRLVVGNLTRTADLVCEWVEKGSCA